MPECLSRHKEPLCFVIGVFEYFITILQRRHHFRSVGREITQRQRYQCRDGERQFDDLSETICEGHPHALRVWVLCLYFMGLNLSNQQIAAALDLDKAAVQDMTTQLREGIAVKKSRSS
jgi:transposase-like protein